MATAKVYCTGSDYKKGTVWQNNTSWGHIAAGQTKNGDTTYIAQLTFPSLSGYNNISSVKLYVYRVSDGYSTNDKTWTVGYTESNHGSAQDIASFTTKNDSWNSIEVYSGVTNKVPINKAFYIHLYNKTTKNTYGEISSYYGSSTLKAYLEVTYQNYTTCGAPTSVTRKSSNSFVVPSGDFEVQWSGATSGTNNTINGYRVYWKIGSAPSTSNYTGYQDVATTATSGSTKISLSNATRGSAVYVGVVTKGTAGSSYWSSIKTASIITVNSLPAAPSVTANKYTVPSTGGTVTFAVTAGSDSNSSQSLKKYVKKGSSGDWTEITGTTYTPTVTSTTTFYFSTYDGLEYSSSISKTITVNTKPSVRTITITPTKLSGIPSNTGYSLVNNLSASCTTSKTVSSYEWYCSYASNTSVGTSGTRFTTTTSNSLSNFNMSTTTIPKANYYRIGVRVYDGYEYSEVLWYTGDSGGAATTYIYQLPALPGYASLSAIYNNPSATSNIIGTTSTQFENGITIKWSNPTVDTGKLNIKESRLIYITSTDGSNWSAPFLSNVTGNTTAEGENIQHLTLSVNRGTYVRFGIRITDVAGNTRDSITTTVRSRANLPSLPGELKPIPTIKPFTNTSTVSFTTANPISSNGAYWYIEAYVEEKTVTIPLLSNGAFTVSGSSVIYTFSAANINSLLKNNALKNSTGNWNDNFTKVKYRVYIKDAFGNQSNILTSSYTSINFIEAPVVSGDITMGIQYTGTGITDSDTYTQYLSNSLASNSTYRMINPGEKLVFKFAQPTDYNNDLESIEISIAKLDAAPSKDFSEYTYSVLATVPIGNLTTSGSNYVYRLLLESYSVNKYIVFQIRARDSRGNYSISIYSNSYLVACRKTNPTVNIGSTSISINPNSQITVKCSVPDIGGSKFSNGTTYSSYPNFERTIELNNKAKVYTKQAQIIIQYATKSDFSDAQSYSQNLSSSSFSTFMSSGISVTTNQISTSYQNKKLYIRAQLLLSTGFGTGTLNSQSGLDIVSAYSATATYYAAGPTVAHRYHAVGINASNLEDTDAFVVSDFVSTVNGKEIKRKVVRFVGANKTMTINLDTSAINGAVIDCGTW